MGTKPSPHTPTATQDNVTVEAQRFETYRKASRAYQDGIIGRRLPGWLRDAPVAQLPEIGKALAQSLACRQQLNRLLTRLQDIDGFVESALATALQDRYGITANLRRMRFLEGRREPVINEQPVGAHLTKVVYEEKPLLEVALRNFTAEQALAGGQPVGNRLLMPRQGSVKPPTAIEFAALCRELDLGEAYQRHLDSILSPGDRDERVEALLRDASRFSMLVDAYKARQEQQLDDSELRLLVAMCIDGKLLRLAGDLVVARRLSLLGCELEQIVVLQVIDQGPLLDTTRRLLMHVPGDPVAAWSAFASMDELARALGNRLREPSYQRFFTRFVRRRDSQAFFSTIIPDYADLPAWATLDLKPRLRAYPAPLFNSLAHARVRQIKDDAAVIAMPVAELDREVQRAHDERLAAQGWTLLNVAGLFVPVIGAALLAVAVWELLDEVYHGIEAWRDGDHQEALDHLTNVAIDLAAIGAVAVGGVVVRRLWTRSSLVDAMVPAQLENGSTKLWQQDLMPYRSTLPGAAATRDAQGIWRLGDHAWIEMDGHHYPVVEQGGEGQWQLRPHNGHGPALRSNGAGAWRLWSEQPADWRDTHRMFRRLGEPLNQLNDEQIDQVLLFQGMDGDHVRALHVYGLAPEPGMLDSAQRIGLDQRIRRAINRLRGGEVVDDPMVLDQARGLTGAQSLSDQALAELAWTQRRLLLGRLYEAQQPVESPGSATLRRVFTGLYPRAAQALVEAANVQDRRTLLEHGRVPLRLAEAARRCVLGIRTARVFEAFNIDTPQNADLARVALGMLKHLPGGEQGIRWRLFEGYFQGPLLASTELGQQAFDLVHTNGAFQLRDTHGVLLGEPGELFDVMARAYGASQREAMAIAEPFAHNLRVILGLEAAQRRAEVKRLLSPLRPGATRLPLRLADGRLGYPLGGCSSGELRGADRSLSAMLRELYPTFTDEQVEAWITHVQRSGRRVETVLSTLQQQLTVLRNTLSAWVGEVEGDVWEDRDSFRTTMIDCWRRTVSVGESQLNTDQDYRIMTYNSRLGELPPIPAQVSFAHVSEMSLLRMDLEDLPSSFLLAFPRLQVLDLGGNYLTRLPQSLLQMQHLRHLTFTNNEIVLDMAQSAMLASCGNLEYVDLSYNPLGRAFTLAGLTRLRWLNLRSTAIRQFPSGLLNHELVYVDLRENRIRHIPERFYQASLRTRRSIRLAGNPLGEAEMMRLHASLMDISEPVDEALRNEQLAHARQVWGDAIGPRLRGLLMAAWETVDQGAVSERLFRVLQQLVHSADFHIDAPSLANRVLALLQAMAMDASLRDELFVVANDEWGCQDGATWCLSNLELNVLTWRARTRVGGNPERSLLALGRRLWRQDAVDRYAAQEIRLRQQRGGNPDESEVGLAYRVGLRDRLGLPITVGSMSFRLLSGVDEAALAEAETRILAWEQNVDDVARSLVDRAFWREHLERTYPDRFASVDEPFRQRLETVLDDDTLTDEQRRDQSDATLEEQRAARRALMLDITLRAMEIGPEDPGIDV
ncbi:MAG: NEL-type E3 ubiquitin ligase domain-containing protein [Pseudomonas sp.]|uniref:RING-type E3 ubiquitin transferase n=1 Tax=Pseudomonas taiwanensis TaxID=470150 RepID=A0ABR6V1B8_9PSED|nr:MULTISPECIES: NEL-type E3 ubiquitin ligase domain-containing protein [Pseudomonas]AGZ35730.1 hypothetical protein PVLB_14730 [Pseudomonas sp. VLB120]AVD89780.1 hypothetical protein C4Q26_22675 [Pseudomonas sp. SWI44]MBC3474315.1 hypothetical protein [Pseudomonas taiwanensis]MBC3491774.1 hypothetical protein [Pseudomonas taiwanensis]MPT01809.1 hypothetical protein [Pseudomonas sp.]